MANNIKHSRHHQPQSAFAIHQVTNVSDLIALSHRKVTKVTRAALPPHHCTAAAQLNLSLSSSRHIHSRPCVSRPLYTWLSPRTCTYTHLHTPLANAAITIYIFTMATCSGHAESPRADKETHTSARARNSSCARDL